ncbi:tetratricopeptide repeat protein [Collinsella aerofaciens]|uniref:Photosystem I assembly protein Ycf3 n=1 Tax=Collinsella aerofaciens TaxID=74426 RepID=A0A5K1JGV4_9ACTN|nr:tetratricopeptide repeat protein [Collinsella aerofaciens]VWL65482.1 Photosystem I assembly protein Ycf3 [Collinsella aerofaciens]VWM03778.1 Photosystem I assembly protein Ycf3 [Collinsella aerofaciens]
MGLFGFGKKKEKVASAAAETAPVLDRDAVLDAVKTKHSELEGKEGVAVANVLNEIGKLYADANMVDEAVEAYEQSLEVNRTMGKASAALVKLYNKKRAAAAEAKDDEAIKYYMDKVTEMLAISKDQLRGK